MAECPKLNNRTGPYISLNTVHELTPSTYNRTVGTFVKVSCLTNYGYYLIGQDAFTCQSNGKWDYSSKPYCQRDQSTVASNELSNESKILIGAVVPVAVIIIIILIILICCVRREKRRDGYKDRILPHQQVPVPLSNYSEREYESRPYVVEGDIHKDYTTSVTRLQPPPYRYRYPDYFEHSQTPATYKTREIMTIPANDYGDYSHMSQRMGPIMSRDIYDTPYLSEPGGRVTKKPYVGEWVSRSTSGALDLDEFNSDALRHGRDPLLWRNSYSSWGHHAKNTSKP